MKTIFALFAAAMALTACARPNPIATPLRVGPFAAVLLVPGCAGAGEHTARAAQDLTQSGFAVSTLDWPSGACRADDAAAGVPTIERALLRLAAVPGVDRTRLHLVGWAEGGASVLAAMARTGVRSAAAFYPSCAGLREWRPTGPVLLMMGENDTIAPPETCLAAVSRAQDSDKVLAVRYGGVAHGFDEDGPGWAFWRSSAANAHNKAVRDAAFSDLRIFLDAYAAK
jgi:dienelactone hydrolase